MKLKKSEVLRRQGEFHKVISRGELVVREILTCYYSTDNSEHPSVLRVGFAVTSKTVKAVDRNRLKRLMREAYRQVNPLAKIRLPQGKSINMVFLAKKVYEKKFAYELILSDMESILIEIRSKMS